VPPRLTLRCEPCVLVQHSSAAQQQEQQQQQQLAAAEGSEEQGRVGELAAVPVRLCVESPSASAHGRAGFRARESALGEEVA
jgi:hypothetical protein